MATKALIFLTLIGICFANPLVEQFTTVNPHPIEHPKSEPYVFFRVATAIGFTEAEKDHARSAASFARSLYGLNQMAEMAAYVRNYYDNDFGGYWNCMTAYQYKGDSSGWRASRYIHLIAEDLSDHFFMCSQGCNSGSCTKFGAII